MAKDSGEETNGNKQFTQDTCDATMLAPGLACDPCHLLFRTSKKSNASFRKLEKRFSASNPAPKCCRSFKSDSAPSTENKCCRMLNTLCASRCRNDMKLSVVSGVSATN